MNQADILRRIQDLLALSTQAKEVHGNAAQLSQGCVSLLSLVYGEKSVQVQQFTSQLESLSKEKGGFRNFWIATAAQGTLTNLKAEIEGELTGRLRHQITAEVLTDFILLSKTALSDNSDGAKNVAAVLAAAAFEDTIRRMGETFAGIVGKDDLSDILTKLKDSGVIQSPQVGIAQSYLSFRNHALHANWDKIEREAIHSVLSFVEQLLLKHFA